jgi:replicative DNA helicase
MKFDLEFEESVLSAALRSDEFLKQASRTAKGHHFATKHHSWVWEVLERNWNQYRERPTLGMFVEEARHTYRKAEERRGYLELLSKLAKTKPKAPKSALKLLTSFVTKVQYHKVAETLVDALEVEDLDKAKIAFQQGTRVAAQERRYKHVRWIEEFEERQARRKYEATHPGEFRVIPTPWPAMNRVLGGGTRTAELCLLMGTTGRGKSIAMNNIAHSSVKAGFSTVIFAFEMGASQVAMRQDATWSGLSYEKFKGYKFKPSELRDIKRKRARMAKRFGNRLHIVSFPVRSANINDVRAALQDLNDEWSFKPDLVIFDSLDHLLAIESAKEAFRLQQSEVYWSAKRLGEEENFSAWSSVHAGREWSDKVATAEATSESYDKSRIADLVASLNDPFAKTRRMKVMEISDEEDDEEPEIQGYARGNGPRTLKMHMAKYRDGDSQFSFEVKADFAKMRITEVKKDKEDEDDDEGGEAA